MQSKRNLSKDEMLTISIEGARYRAYKDVEMLNRKDRRSVTGRSMVIDSENKYLREKCRLLEEYANSLK